MDKTKIDWADSSWNPVTGCLHDCQYCYARKMANQYSLLKAGAGIGEHIGFFENVIGMDQGEDFTVTNDTCIYLKSPVEFGGQKKGYPTRFNIPTFHKYRLNHFQKKKGRSIFVCSMADLFGDWVPDEWIEEVFKACEAAPQHRYLFLTKNPKRIDDLPNIHNFSKNNEFWFGTTITNNTDVISHHVSVGLISCRTNKQFISFEPLQKDIVFFNLRKIIAPVEWVIIGAETGNQKDKVIPKREWIENIVNKCRATNIPVFMKSSLTDIWKEELIQQYPWEV